MADIRSTTTLRPEVNTERTTTDAPDAAGVSTDVTVSVVMCTFNGEPFIRQQLDSILNQTLRPTEIIVSDDGSTDRTLQVVTSVANATDIDIRVFRNSTRLGFSDNFLQASGYARGKYIAFSDQDDDWSPRKLEVSLGALIENNAQLAVHKVDKMDARGARIEGAGQSFTQTAVIPPLRSHPWGNFLGFTMMFERSLLGHLPSEARGKDPHARDAPLSHDRWVYFLAATFGRTVVLPESLARYRQHDGQLYGGLRGRSLGERVATKLTDGREQAVYLADLAAHRASLLESLLPVGAVEPGHPGAAAAGAAWWRSVAAHIGASAQLYDCRSPSQRVARLLKNVFTGSYRSHGHGGLGARRFVEDVTIVVLIGVRRELRWADGNRFRRSLRSAGRDGRDR